ncbi:MAG: small basic protein [Phycisphaeraceae bacterium]|nr:small basic protein [Phycisphaeraceae bacterium]MCW5763959.1 small basic protein [Phycisphaeraceae bacterium]
MSLDSSLKTKNSLAGVRSVMKRSERIAKLAADKRFDPKKDHALGLPKTKPNEK